MMPLAPTPVMAMPMSKPKIGFSIDAIVGNRSNKTAGGYSPASETADRPLTPLSDGGYPTEFSKIMAKTRVPNSPDDGQTRLSESSITEFQHRINRYAHEMATDINKNQSVMCKSPPSPQHSPPPQTRLSPDDNQNHHRTPPPPMPQHSPQHPAKGPIIVPGIPAGLVRPFPVPPPHGMPDIKSLPPYMNANEMMSAAHNQHFLAAQFQAALANAGHGFPPGGLPPHGPHMHNPNMPRESYPLYPWLLSRHGRIFPHRFPGNFLLQPFRKPKRIRTAFSPSQLLKLEHAFENNHYVVGAERKQLAQNLSLSETQVKVWFQNRRTKHKRMQQEEGTKGKGDGSSKNPGSPSNLSYDEDDELIDMEMDDECPSDEENNQL